MNRKGGLVYSTGSGRMCPRCKWPVDRCACRAQDGPALPSGDGVVRVRRETRGRKGKGVTTVTGVPLPPDGLAELARNLKKKCGSGGTLKGGIIEIQGDHVALLMDLLVARGFSVKRSGG